MSGEACRFLPWDSQFFGLRIAAVNDQTLTKSTVTAINAFCAAEAIDCLYFRARPDDPITVQLAEANDFHLVDIRLTFAREVLQSAEKLGGIIRHATPDDLDPLCRIARASHTDTRFYFDPQFDREKCGELYARWIANSLSGSSFGVLVAEIDQALAGYITCDKGADGEGAIGLIAVDAAYQGRGLGRSLVEAAVDMLSRVQVKRISVVTQGRNIAAQRLYGRCGFIARDLQLYYHRWFTRPPVGSA